jgi:hypothetical protein
MTDIARPPIVADDLAHRSVDIHWPDGLSPSAADLFAHNEITISAPRPRAWHHLIRATCWPRWYSNAANVVMEEIGLGDTAENLVASSSGHKPRGHDLWNVSLKFLCEAEHVSPHRADAHCARAQIAR